MAAVSLLSPTFLSRSDFKPRCFHLALTHHCMSLWQNWFHSRPNTGYIRHESTHLGSGDPPSAPGGHQSNKHWMPLDQSSCWKQPCLRVLGLSESTSALMLLHLHLPFCLDPVWDSHGPAAPASEMLLRELSAWMAPKSVSDSQG